MRESRELTLKSLNNGEINSQASKEDQKTLNSSTKFDMEENMSKSENESLSNRSKELKEVRDDIKQNMPMPLSEFSEKDFDDEDNSPTLEEIEKVLDVAAADKGSAALYYKVRDAIALYRKEVNINSKINMLLAVRESAFNYLLEKKGNARARKKVCNDIIKIVDKYVSSNNISKERDLSYLLNQDNIPDEKLDLEIRLAGKLTVKGRGEYKRNLKDNRKAFRKRISYVKHAGALKKTLDYNDKWALKHIDSIKNDYNVFDNARNTEYDNAVSKVVSGYMNIGNSNINLSGMSGEEMLAIESTDDKKIQLGTNMLVRLSASDDMESRIKSKGIMIEGIMADILKWDPTEFAFDKNEDFLNRKANKQGQKSSFLELYNKLRIADNADVLLNELIYLKNNNLYDSNLNENVLKELRARLNLYKEISKEYTNRLNIMESPYYALLIQEDIDKFDTQDKINSLTEEKQIKGISGKKSVGKRFKDYLNSIFNKNSRLKSSKKNGGGFTRKTDVNKLLKWHRKKVNVSTNNVESYVDLFSSLTKTNLEDEIQKKDESWLLENIKKKEAEPFKEVNVENPNALEVNAEQKEVHDNEALAREDNVQLNIEQEKNVNIQVDEDHKQIEEKAKDENIQQNENPEQIGEKAKDENIQQNENLEQIDVEVQDEPEPVNLFKEQLKNKQSEISKLSPKYIADTEARLDEQWKKNIKKEYEEEKKTEQFRKSIIEKQRSITSKSKAWADDLDAKQAQAANERIILSSLLQEYEDLEKNDMPMDKAYSLREKMVTKLISITGVESEYIEFTPVEKLVEFITYALENQYAEKSQENLKKQIIDLDNSYSSTEDDSPLIDHINKLMEKGDKMTVKDKLIAHDYCSLLICMNRSDDNNAVVYKNYNDFDLKYLAKAAKFDSKIYNTLPKEEETFDTISEEQARNHEQLCRQIASEYTGKDPDYFRVFPIDKLSKFAIDMNDIANKEKSAAAVEKCLELGEKAHERINTIDEALTKNDRAGIISAIDKLSGIKADKLKGFATSELRDVLISMYANIYSPETLTEQTNWLISENSKRFGTDYYKARLKDSHRNVWLRRDLGDSPDFEDLRAMAEYSILYLKQHPGFEDLQFEDFASLSPDEVYYVYKNVGIIEGLKGTEDKYELNDLSKAISELAGMKKMSEKLKASLEKTLDVNFAKVPKLIDISEDAKYYFKDEEMHDWIMPKWMVREKEKEALKERPIIEREKGLEEELTKEELLIKENHIKHLDKLRKNMKRSLDTEVAEVDDRAFSGEAEDMLNILGDIAMLSGQSDLDSGLVQKVRQILIDNAKKLVGLLKYNSNKIMKAASVFSELKTSVGSDEKVFFEYLESGLMPVITALSNALSQSEDKKAISELDVINVLNTGELDDVINGFVDQLDTNLDMLEKNVLPVMLNATSDIYNKGEEGENIPLLREIMTEDMKDLIDTAEKAAHIGNLEAAKNTREKLELQKKSKEQTYKERGMLNDMHDSLLYDSKKGQGRFNQLLISGYYKNASKADQRKMLSFIIRDMKKKGKYTTEKEQGCEYFAATMKGAGPLMQKMMQGIPERMVMSELSVALGVVKSSLSHIDQKYVDKVFDDMIKDSNGKITSITDRKSLGAASVAETFKCTISGPNIRNHEVVVKILRPDAQENMKKDLDFVRRAAMFADMSDAQMEQYEKENGSNLVDHEVKVTESGFLAQFSEIEKEFDFTNEAKNCKLGKENYVDKYNKKKNGSDNYHVKSVQINEYFAPQKHYLVMDMAKGVTVDKIIGQANTDCKKTETIFRNTNKTIADNMVLNAQNVGQFWKQRKNMTLAVTNSVLTEKLVADLAYVWLEQALFGSSAFGFGDDPNFHHGDMHAGNIMCDGTNTTVLDYGNAVILKDSKVNQILSMLTSVVIESSKDFVEAFNNMLILSAKDEEKSNQKVGYMPLNEDQQAKFIAKLDELFKLGTAEDTGKKILVALNIAQSLGVKLPKEIQNFSQCQQRLENTLLEAKNTATKSINLLEKMDNMSVAPEDMNSFDPLIKLHLFLQDPNNRSKKAIERFYNNYETRLTKKLVFEVHLATTKEDLHKTINKNFPPYEKLKSKISPEKSRAMATSSRQMLKEAEQFSLRGEKVPMDLVNKIRNIAADMFDLHYETDFFGGLIDLDSFNEAMNNSFLPFDLNYGHINKFALEKVLVYFEHIIPTVIEQLDKVEGTLSEVSNDDKKERARKSKVTDIVFDAIEPLILCNSEALEFRMRLRDSKEGEKKEEFERQAARMLKSKYFKKKYDAYRNAEALLDDLVGSGNQEEIKKARKNFLTCEYSLLNSFAEESRKDVSSVTKNYEKNELKAELADEDFLPDFVGVMGDVVESHWKRSIGKINSGLAMEVRNRNKEKEMLEEAIKKEEKEEAEKAKKAAALKAKRKKEEEAKRLKEEAKKKKEEAKRLKEEAKRLKEETKKRIEEAKRLKAEEDARKKKAKELMKKNKKK